MKCFALTGGIASGKSTVSAMLQKSNIPIINADVLARQVVEPNSAGIRQIAEIFGKDFLDNSGALNRKKMADLIFTNAEARKKLENITHPLIAEQLRFELNQYENKKTPYVIYEAPLIFEKGLQSFFDATILVTAQIPIQEKRLKKRDNISIEEVRTRMRTQMSTAEKEKQAHFVIDNSGTLSETWDQLQRIWFQLTEESLKP